MTVNIRGEGWDKVNKIIANDPEGWAKFCEQREDFSKPLDKEAAKAVLGSKSVDEFTNPELIEAKPNIYDRYHAEHKNDTLEEMEAFIKAGLEAHKEEDIKRNKAKTKEELLEAREQVVRNLHDEFQKRIKEQRRFYIIYATNITPQMVLGFSIWEKNNRKYLFNKEEGIKIYDKGSSIVSNLEDESQEALTRAVALSLSIAESKGWDISKMELQGTDAYLAECRRQIEAKLRGEPIELPAPLEPKEDLPMEDSASSNEEAIKEPTNDENIYGRVIPIEIGKSEYNGDKTFTDTKIKYSQEQRRFFVNYKRNIDEDTISGYNIWDKEGTKFLFNKAQGIRLFDKKKELSAKVASKEALANAVAVTLDVAQVKGWNLDTLKIQGTPEYKAEVQRQIDFRLGRTEPEKADDTVFTPDEMDAVKRLARGDRLSKQTYEIARLADLLDSYSEKAEGINCYQAIQLASEHLKSNDDLFFAKRGYIYDRNMPDMKYTPHEFLSRRCNLTKSEVNDFVERTDFSKTKDASSDIKLDHR